MDLRVAPVSGRCFPISVSQCPRPVRQALRPGRGAEHSRGNIVPELLRLSLLRSSYYRPTLSFCSAQEYGKARARPVTVTIAGAVPSMIAEMMRGDTKARGASRLSAVHPGLPALRCLR